MLEILATGNYNEGLKEHENNPKEFRMLYSIFQSLISDKKFQQNKQNKSDALAVIDLAETCLIYDEPNYKAAGVCYNNIANL